MGRFNVAVITKPNDKTIHELMKPYNQLNRDYLGPDEEKFGADKVRKKFDSYSFDGIYSGVRLKNGLVTSSALIKDVDFSTNQKIYRRCKLWWELNIEDRPPQNADEKRLCAASLFPSKEKYIGYYENKEHYALSYAAFHTYAVITPDGVWHEEGNEHLFHYSNLSRDKNARFWAENYYERFIKHADPNWVFTVLTCHI